MNHVVPINLTSDGFDVERGHEFDTTCPCGVRVETDGEMLVIHSAFDDRERSVENAIQDGRIWTLIHEDEEGRLEIAQHA